jgi:subtilisin family serine protease
MPDRDVASNPDELLAAALEHGGDTSKTGRYLMTFKPGAAEAGHQMLQTQAGFRTASAGDFDQQAFNPALADGADVAVFPEIGVALVGGEALETRSTMSSELFTAADSPVQSIDPEYFMFATAINSSDYLRGFVRAAQAIAADLGEAGSLPGPVGEVGAEVLGATWGLTACRVPPSSFGGNVIRVAVLDTGLDVGHPEFAGRPLVSSTFVGQGVQDLNGHGTHTIGTASGPNNPPGQIPRYGIGYETQIYCGKVLTNSGSGTMASVLAGINWAIANNCQIISMSLGAAIPVQTSYTNAGNAALARGCLIIAATGNDSHRPSSIVATGAPANSPTVMAVAALDRALRVAQFSNGGKVDIAGPGVNVYSAYPRPVLHNTLSGTSMATPHVSGVAALWAQTNPALRGQALWARLQATARQLPLPVTDVGAGLVQAP